MITDLDILDHTILIEDEKCMLLLIFDSQLIWEVEKLSGFHKLKLKHKIKEKNLEHLIYLKKKIENYINYIYNNGILKSFPECTDWTKYRYEIRISSDFKFNSEFIRLIDYFNSILKKQRYDIIVTYEHLLNEKSI